MFVGGWGGGVGVGVGMFIGCRDSLRCSFGLCLAERPADSLVEVWLGLFTFNGGLQGVHVFLCAEGLSVMHCIVGLCGPGQERGGHREDRVSQYTHPEKHPHLCIHTQYMYTSLHTYHMCYTKLIHQHHPAVMEDDTSFPP